MRFPSGDPGDLLRRLFLGALLAVTASGLAAPALAQTIRFSPSTPNFPVVRDPNGRIDPNLSASTVDIFMDDVPAEGLKGFDIRFTFDASTLALVKDNNALDPNLDSIWGAGNNVSPSPHPPAIDPNNANVIHWFASSSLLINQPTNFGGPVGTVKLGKITFLPQGNGLSSNFVWDSNLSNYTAVPFTQPLIPNLENSAYTVGTATVDLAAISCTQTSLPVDANGTAQFVDGDTISLNCTVTNQGTSRSPGTAAVAYISEDMVVDSHDALIGDSPVKGLAPNGPGDPNASTTFTITGTPPFTTQGDMFICAKVDASSNANALGGIIFETDETNNTRCLDLDVQFARRDLTPFDPNSPPNMPVPLVAVAGPVDPNVINAGNALRTTVTVSNIGTAVVRDHKIGVVLSSDEVFDPSDPNDLVLCKLPVEFLGGSIPPGLLGGTSETESFGLDPNLPCVIGFSQPPGTYFIGVVADIDNQVSELDPNGNSLKGNNTAFVQFTLQPPVPPTLVAAQSAAVLNDRQQELDGQDPNHPASSTANFDLFSVPDLGSFALTVTWAPAATLEIQSLSDITVFPSILDVPNPSDPNNPLRTGSCVPSTFDNTAGTVTIDCTSTGTGPSLPVDHAKTILSVHFHVLEPTGNTPGTFTFSNVSLADSNGLPLTPSTPFGDGTFVVTGHPDNEYSNLVAPVQAIPGANFTTTFKLCNQGFVDSPIGTRSSVQISPDPNISLADPVVCSFLESAVVPARQCVDRSIPTCTISTDLRPGLYTLGVTDDPATQAGSATVSIALPPRVLALRNKGGHRAIESTVAPDSGGSVGPVLASDNAFTPLTIGGIRTVLRNFDMVAGYLKPTKGREVGLYRTPKLLKTDIDKQATYILRLPVGTIAVLGGADIDGDGEDELILLKTNSNGQFLDFRRVNYAKRRPEVGSSIAVTAPMKGKILGAAGIQFDGDPEDELAVVIDDGTSQTLSINDVVINDPNGPVPSSLVEQTSDPNFGGGSAGKIEQICVMDYGLDGTPLSPSEQIVALVTDSTGVQELKVFDPPMAVGAASMLVAADPQFGGKGSGSGKVISIACTR